MQRIQLVHWKEAEGRERAKELRAAGLSVEYEADGAVALRVSKEELPEAIVIDLTRLPSHGRGMATALRQSKKTRLIPLVFAGGDPAKVARIRKELPDATFTDWSGVVRALERAIAAPLRETVVPEMRRFYTDKPLAGKLGVKAGTSLALVDAPEGFERALGELPEGATLKRGLRGRCDVVLWFVRSEKELRRALPKWKAAAGAGTRLWVACPKKGSSVGTDLDVQRMRTAPLGQGLVDYKVCAIDADWTGICFALRKS